MSNFATYNLVLGTGVRDAEAVAAELRGALPAAIDAVANNVTAAGMLREDGPKVSAGENLVYYHSPRDWDAVTNGWSDLVTELDVPARWACAVWRQEAGNAGGAFVYGWVDGGFVQVDETMGQNGASGRDAVAAAEWAWDAVGSHEDDGQGERVEETAPAPGAVAGFEPVDRGSLPDPETALSELDAADPDQRRRAAEQLYVLVGERGQSPGLSTRLVDACDDPAARFGAAATVRELDSVGNSLESDDPARRRAAVRATTLRANRRFETADERAAVRRALGDPDATVRAAAGRAFERVAFESSTGFETADIEALRAASGDEDAGVRAAAFPALLRATLRGDTEYVDTAVAALADGALDPDPAVRAAVGRAVGTLGRDDYGRFLPTELLETAVVAVSRADAEAATEPPEAVVAALDDGVRRLPLRGDPPVGDLVALGWDADSSLARTLIASVWEVGQCHDRIGGRLLDLGTDPESVFEDA